MGVGSRPKVIKGQAIGFSPNKDMDKLLKIIKMSNYNVVDQLHHTPSKILMLSLLMSFAVHRDSMMKVLEQSYIDHDVTVDQFTIVVDNIIACNNLSFCDEELPEEGKNL